jgi:hypothetical protein
MSHAEGTVKGTELRSLLLVTFAFLSLCGYAQYAALHIFVD